MLTYDDRAECTWRGDVQRTRIAEPRLVVPRLPADPVALLMDHDPAVWVVAHQKVVSVVLLLRVAYMASPCVWRCSHAGDTLREPEDHRPLAPEDQVLLAGHDRGGGGVDHPISELDAPLDIRKSLDRCLIVKHIGIRTQMEK